MNAKTVLNKRGSAKRHLLLGIAFVVLLISVFFASRMMKMKPSAKKGMRPSQVPLVSVQAVTSRTEQVQVKAMGEVMPATKITLRSRVGGEIREIHPAFREGGLIKKGDVIIKIDPSDYEIAIKEAEASLALAKADFSLEKGLQDVARHEWEMLGEAGSEEDSDSSLALRVPQLRAAEAKIASAMARLSLAKLNRERTELRAAFNAVVVSAAVRVGDQASPQGALGQLVGTDVYWIRVSVPVSSLKWLRRDDVIAKVTTAAGDQLQGRMLQVLPDLEPQGRMARLLVAVDDPMGLSSAKHGELLLGAFVDVTLFGVELEDVVVLQRHIVRDGRRLWMIEGGGTNATLVIRDLELLWEDRERVLVKETQFEEGQRIVVSDLASAINAMTVRVEGELPEKKSVDGDLTKKGAVTGAEKSSGKQGVKNAE